MKDIEFKDSLVSVTNGLANIRNAQSTNSIVSKRILYPELRQIYKTGLGSKIVRIKAGYALNDTIQFEKKDQKEYYEKHIAQHVKDATKFMLGFGRGIIVLMEPGANLSKPLKSNNVNLDTIKLKSFSGDMVSVAQASMNLTSDRYMKPTVYVVRGQRIHWTRVIDFNYVLPSEFELPSYFYGGMSEFELIYPQLINDGVVERATPVILEKNSTLFYKLQGFKKSVQEGQQDNILKYFSTLESARSIYGAGIIDGDDEIAEVSQTLSNLSEADQITLRRLAMVTGIPIAILVGESVKGLNSTGDSEMKVFQDNTENMQSDYLLTPINSLMSKLGLPPIKFKENQSETPLVRVQYDAIVIENAFKLFQMGEDHSKYLEEKDITEKDKYSKFFKPKDDELDEDELDEEELMEENKQELDANNEKVGE